MRCEPYSVHQADSYSVSYSFRPSPRLGRIFRPSHRRWRMARVARTAAQMWLYPMVEYQRSLLTPFSVWAACAANGRVNPCGPLACVSGARCFAASYELLYRLSKTVEKPG